MGRICTVCTSPQRAAIEAALLTDTPPSLSELGRAHGVTWQAVRYHRDKCQWRQAAPSAGRHEAPEVEKVSEQQATARPQDPEVRLGIRRHWAKRRMQYCGRWYDRGELVPIAGAVNDEKLLRMHFLVLVEEGQPLYECRVCQRQFVASRLRDEHGRSAHRPAAANPEIEDRRAEAEWARLQKEDPVGQQSAASFA